MTKQGFRRKTAVTILLLLLVVALIVVVLCIQNGKRMAIEVPDNKTEYIARHGLDVIQPGLPERSTDWHEATNYGFITDPEGRRGVRLRFDKSVFPVGSDRFEWGTAVDPISTEVSPYLEVYVGDTFEYDGYTFKLTTVDARGDHDSYAGFIIEKLPPDVTFFPSGDPEQW